MDELLRWIQQVSNSTDEEVVKMGFDKTINEEYGVIYGNRDLVYIKTGKGGSICGYNDKYVHLAERIVKEFGYSVIVSANSEESICDLGEEFAYVKEEILEYDRVVFVGFSNGAIVGAQQGHKYPEITDMLLVNGPLTVNWPKTRRGIENFAGNRVLLIYGEKDPSSRYVELLDCAKTEKMTYTVIEGANHFFAGMEYILEEKIIQFLNEK